MRMDRWEEPRRRTHREWLDIVECVWITLLIAAALIGLCCWLAAPPASAAAVPPAPRLARQLAPERHAAVAARRRHNDALRALFRKVGVPDGSDPESVARRAAAIELINAATPNRVELADGGGVTADAVAAAAGDYVGRAATNAPHNNPSR